MASLRFCVRGWKLFGPLVLAQRNYKRSHAPVLKELKRRKDRMGPQPLHHRSTFLEWNYEAELFAYGKRLHEEFKPELLQQALTHRSYIIQEENKQREVGIEDPVLSLKDNQELVQEGAQLIKSYVMAYLRKLLPCLPEEGLLAVHNFLTREEALAELCSRTGTDDLILCADFPPEPATRAATFQAVVGALSLSSGAERARAFVRDLLVTRLSGQEVAALWCGGSDPRKELDDLLATRGLPPVEPRLVASAATGTPLAAYRVGIYSDRQMMGLGDGETVNIAVEVAARDALRRIYKIRDHETCFSYRLDEQEVMDGQRGIQG